MEIMPLEISEVIHKHKTFVAVGTISQRGENYAARGALYILDVIQVVPEPGRPETGKKLHVHGREDTKGGITALMGIAGLVGTAQGISVLSRSETLLILISFQARRCLYEVYVKMAHVYPWRSLTHNVIWPRSRLLETPISGWLQMPGRDFGSADSEQVTALTFRERQTC